VINNWVFNVSVQGNRADDVLGLQAGVPVLPAGLAAAAPPSLSSVAERRQRPAALPLSWRPPVSGGPDETLRLDLTLPARGHPAPSSPAQEVDDHHSGSASSLMTCEPDQGDPVLWDPELTRKEQVGCISLGPDAGPPLLL